MPDTPKAIFKCVQVAGNIVNLLPQGVIGTPTQITLKPEEYGSFKEGQYYEITWKHIDNPNEAKKGSND
jgi:hypothetical protein